MSPLKVLVVDDSAFARKAITRMLQSDPRIAVVAQAADGEEALAQLAAHPVDVVTLDLEMPGLDGLETLRRIKEGHGVPVVVLTGSAARSAAVTLQALEGGAFEVVAKPEGGQMAIHNVAHELVTKVRGAAGKPHESEERRRLSAYPAARPPAAAGRGAVGLVVIGISTGGPLALQKVIPALPADFPVPVLVLQHMPPGYTAALAARLDRMSAIAVAEAADGQELRPGTVLIAPSGRQLSFKKGPGGIRVAIADECPFHSYYRPSIDYTFLEAARCWRSQVLAVVMTGMGNDGAMGLAAVKEAGGHCWAQDEPTSTIFGMPRAAIETGCVDAIFPLTELAPRLMAAVSSPVVPLGLEG